MDKLLEFRFCLPVVSRRSLLPKKEQGNLVMQALNLFAELTEREVETVRFCVHGDASRHCRTKARAGERAMVEDMLRKSSSGCS